MKIQNMRPYAIGPRASIDLSLSENPLGCSSVVQKTMNTITVNPSKYPAANGNDLRQILATQFRCLSENIFVVNGSEAIIFTIPRTLAKPDDQAIIPQLTFPLFRMGCECANLQVVPVRMKTNLAIDLAAIKQVTSKQTKLLFLCNPNNPTGMILSRKEIIQFLDDIPKNVIIVVDEANIEFGGESVIDQVLQRNNVLVLRTFSKGFGLAGFRVGFAVGNVTLIKQMRTKSPPFPISSMSEQLAIAALSDIDFVEKSKKVMDKEREKINNNRLEAVV